MGVENNTDEELQYFEPDLYGISKNDKQEGREVVLLYSLAIITLAVALYNAFVLFFITGVGRLLVFAKYATLIAFLLSMAEWCRTFASYKSDLRTRNVNPFSEYYSMKIISFITGILCLARLLTLAYYFVIHGDFSPEYSLYVGGELLLLSGLTLFFLYFANDMRKKTK